MTNPRSPNHASTIPLTDEIISGLQRKRERYEVPDKVATGLRVRVGTSGKKVFICRYSYLGKVATKTLGIYPTVSLKAARDAVLLARKRMTEGKQPFMPGMDVPPDLTPQFTENVMTFKEVAEEYLRQPHIKRLRTYKNRVMQIRHHIIPVLGRLPINAINKRVTRSFVNSIIDRDAPAQAAALQLCIKFIIRYAEDEEYIPSNPLQSLRSPYKYRPRERILSVDELRTLWTYITHPKEWRSPTCRCLGFLIATGQRRQECAFIHKTEVDIEQREWTLPGSRAKNGRPHIIPLTQWHFELLGKANTESGFFFHSVRGENGAMSLSSITTYVRRYIIANGCDHFTVHDLRRTFATHLGRLRVSRDIRKRLLNHSDGDVTGIYDRYDYLEEKRHAMEVWCDFLLDKVVRR